MAGFLLRRPKIRARGRPNRTKLTPKSTRIECQKRSTFHPFSRRPYLKRRGHPITDRFYGRFYRVFFGIFLVCVLIAFPIAYRTEFSGCMINFGWFHPKTWNETDFFAKDRLFLDVGQLAVRVYWIVNRFFCLPWMVPILTAIPSIHRLLPNLNVLRSILLRGQFGFPNKARIDNDQSSIMTCM